MTDDEPAGDITLPLSPAVLGVIARSLPTSKESVTGRTARRFYTGEPVNEHDREDVFQALAAALVEVGVLPVPPVFVAQGADIIAFASRALLRLALRWDRAVAELQSNGLTRVNEAALMGLLSAVAVDLAIRVFAVTRLAELPATASDAPLWSQERGFGKVLRQAAKEVGLTQAGLARAAGLGASSVKYWCDGRGYPKVPALKLLSSALTVASGRDEDRVFQQLARQLVFAKLCDALAIHITRDGVVELVAGVLRLSRYMALDVERMDRRLLMRRVRRNSKRRNVASLAHRSTRF